MNSATVIQKMDKLQKLLREEYPLITLEEHEGMERLVEGLRRAANQEDAHKKS